MADDRYRALLRRVALGLPLVVGPLAWSGCPFGGGDCGDPARETVVVTEAPDGGTDCYAACPSSYGGKSLVDCRVDDGGARWSCDYEYRCLGGRRPDEAPSAWLRGPTDPVGRWCLELAVVEAASVPAFHTLADALRTHGAPPTLIDRARVAAEDEVRHARLALRLAGGGDVRVHVPRVPTPSLEALARSNAAEGCVREAYGALEAAWQSERAASPLAREVFATIARDEAGHALLSRDVDAWLRPAVAARVTREAREEAIAELRASFEDRARPDGLGLPDAAEARALLALAA